MKAKAPSSACSDKRTHLAHRLHEAVPPGAKLALCFDPEGDLDGLESIADNAARVWRLVTYQENDLAFRITLHDLEQHEWTADTPILVRVATPEFVPVNHRVDLSFLGDLLSRVEGQPIDLRTDAVVAFHTEAAIWPENLQDHASRISGNLKGFVDGYKRLRAAIGRERPLGRHHIPAVLLLAKARELDYRDLELPHAYPAEVVARFLSVSTVHEFDAEDERLLWEVLLATGHVAQEDQLRPWREFPPHECIMLLVLSDFLEAHGVQNVTLSLSGLGLFSRPVHELLPLLNQVRASLKEECDVWPHLVQRMDQTCTQAQVAQAISLLTVMIPPAQWVDLVQNDTPRTVALALLLGYLDEWLAKSTTPRPLTLSPSTGLRTGLSREGKGNLHTEPTRDESARIELPERIPSWADSWMSNWEVPHHDAPAEARASVLLRMFSRIATIQSRLATPPLQADEIAALVDAYTESDELRLELLLALARKDADVVNDEARLGRLQEFFEHLQRRVVERLQTNDALVGSLIRQAVQKYLAHPRSTTRFLKPIAARARQGGRRIFVWLFDGMRYDTWTEVVRPILSQSFAIEEEKPLLAPLPTYTQLARKALFAGGYPDTTWKGFGGRFTGDERILAARNFGVTSDREMEQETVFVDHADTDEGKEKLRALKVRRFNCLVFNISDDNLHSERGDLREINDKIRQKVERDVLPEMKRLVGPDDVVVITSDHGFVELDDQQGISMSEGDEGNAVFYRYLYELEHPAGIVVPYSGKKGVGNTTVIIGRSWFNRDKGRYTRYAHGGVSLPEMVVPGVVLHKLEAPEEIRLVISTPERLRVQEDEEFAVPVTVKNNGAALATIRVTIDAGPAKMADLSRNTERRFTETLKAELGRKLVAVVVEIKGPDGRYAVVQGGTRQIPLSVKERADKVEFSKALDVFRDLE